MTFTFTNKLPDNLDNAPVLISGYESSQLDNNEYLLIEGHNDQLSIYEIRYKAGCSPFKEAIIIDNLLAVGHEEHFYLFDIIPRRTILRLEVSGYFGQLYFNDGQFLVACASGLYSINKTGKITWQNLNLSIDGTLVTTVSDGKIYCRCQLDPPDGWKNLVLNNRTGLLIK